MLTLEQWNVERAKLILAQQDIQSVIDDVDAAFDEPASGVAWSRVGVSGTPTFLNGDLTVTATAAHALRSTASAAAAYAEVEITALGNPGYFAVGVVSDAQSLLSPPTSLATVPAGMWLWRSDSYKANDGQASMVGPVWATGDNIGICFHGGNLWFRRNGTWIQGDPDTAVSPVFSGLPVSLGLCVAFFGANGGPVATGRFVNPIYSIPTSAPLFQV